jgi:hypothetical protein
MYLCIIYSIKFIKENKKNGKRIIFCFRFAFMNGTTTLLINLWY